MKHSVLSLRPPRAVLRTASRPNDLLTQLEQRIVGQSAGLRRIAPYVDMFRAGLAPEGRPAGVFLLLGPTGTGKTRTVESLAETLHGSERCMLKVDCGEFQMDHEVAKLVGAPPGYLGHRETVPLLTQGRLAGISSERCPLAIVLFDEIEKAAPSLTRLLLGLLDRGTLRLGDGNTVSFERTLIFLTSNVGAQSLRERLRPSLGFGAGEGATASESSLDASVEHAARKAFAPEFLNRIDETIIYRPLDRAALETILESQLCAFNTHLARRLADRRIRVNVSPGARELLLMRGTSAAYGARELRRALQRHLFHPVARMVLAGELSGSRELHVGAAAGGESLSFRVRRQ